MTPTRVASNVSTAAVAMIAAWSSWSHMVHLALGFGERPEVAYVLPLSVDGMLIVASTAMVEDKRHQRPVRWSARIAFAAGVAASVAANIAAAHPSVGARTVAAWPAVALLLVVEILSRTRPPGAAVGTEVGSTADDDRRIPVPPQGSNENESGPEPGRARRRTTTSTLGRAAVRSRSGGAADIVARIRAERPDAVYADIAAEAGVSERHVRRILASDARHRPPSTLPARQS